jgi:Asp-tRNA(Asn)/Glu-tRNA(Gln) amidotransferase A subunit family amidase
VPGTKTTWGAEHYKDQVIPAKATVVKRLEDAGAVLVAKTTLGALAMGDRWFGGQTRNPWDVSRGSSGSSAGTAAAVSAGLIPFGLGSETLGSIISPATECGITGLRPTFGRISRHGCMTLSWSMDKLGPMGRSAEDCAFVFAAIHGADGFDPTAINRPFDWPTTLDWKQLRIGYVEDKLTTDGHAVLRVFRDFGATLVPIRLPTTIPVEAVLPILSVEAAAAFDDLTRDGVTEGIGNWAITFRQARLISAVDYLRANRLRTLLMHEMARLMDPIDLYLDSSRSDLRITNLTGHPSVCFPSGFRKTDQGKLLPTSVVLTGPLYAEAKLLAVAQAYQEATDFHRRRPDLTTLLNE